MESRNHTYDTFKDEINAHLTQYAVNMDETKILVHALLRLGSINEEPSQLTRINKDKDGKQLSLQLYDASGQFFSNFVKSLSMVFGEGCDVPPDSYMTLLISFSALQNKIDDIKQTMTAILSDPRNLQAYRAYSTDPYYDDYADRHFFYLFEKLTAPYSLSPSNSDCVEETLLKMFDCKETSKHNSFGLGQSYLGKVTDATFHFDISKEAALALVANINQAFPDFIPARFGRENVEDGRGGKYACEIIADAALFDSESFKLRFKETLNRNVEHACVHTLETVAARINEHNTTTDQQFGAKRELVERLRVLSCKIQTSPEAKGQERMTASDDVRRALELFQFFQTRDENKRFKQDEKRVIKEVQTSLGLK